MVVGLLRITLHIPEARSLKDRRAAVRRAVERVRARYNVSVAEVGEQSRWQIAQVAVAVVSSDRALVNELLDRVTSTVANAGAALITEREIEIQSYGDREPLGGGAAGVFAGGGFVAPRDDDDDDDDAGHPASANDNDDEPDPSGHTDNGRDGRGDDEDEV